jgi:hypothetical protein
LEKALSEEKNKNYFITLEKRGKTTSGELWGNKRATVNYASSLASLEFYDRVTVFCEDEDKQKSSVYDHVPEKKMSINRSNSYLMCGHIKDLLSFHARQIMTKVLEPLLEPKSQTAIEAIFSESAYKNAVKQEVIILNAIKKVSSAQSKKYKISENDRYDILFKMFKDMPKFHELVAPLSPYVDVLKEKGLEVLTSSVRKNLPVNLHEVTIYYALAKSISTTSNFLAKLEIILDFYKNNLSDRNKKYLDEFIAEICDRDIIFSEIRSYHFEKQDQINVLVSLCRGEYEENVRTPGYAKKLAEVLKDENMVETQKVFTNFIQTIIRDVSPINQESQEADEKAYNEIFEKLIYKGTLIGDERLAEALVLKGQQVYGDKFGEQASTEETVSKILKKLKNSSAVAHFFMGLSQTPKGQKYNKLIEKKLASTITSWRMIEDAIADGNSKISTIKMLNNFLKSIENTGLSVQIKDQVQTHIENLLFSREAAFPGKSYISTLDGKREPQEEDNRKLPEQSKSGFSRNIFQKGEFIFHEGNFGDEAYIIVSGEVEIFKETEDGEQILGVLGRGAMFGEMAIIDDEPRMAAARAKEQTTLTIIPKDAFRKKLEKLEGFDPVMRRMIDVFLNRIRSNANKSEM